MDSLLSHCYTAFQMVYMTLVVGVWFVSIILVKISSNFLLQINFLIFTQTSPNLLDSFKLQQKRLRATTTSSQLVSITPPGRRGKRRKEGRRFWGVNTLLKATFEAEWSHFYLEASLFNWLHLTAHMNMHDERSDRCREHKEQTCDATTCCKEWRRRRRVPVRVLVQTARWKAPGVVLIVKPTSVSGRHILSLIVCAWIDSMTWPLFLRLKWKGLEFCANTDF